MRRYIALVSLIFTMLGIFNPLLSGTAAAEATSWTSKVICYNYGSDCPSSDGGTINFSRQVILVSATVSWITSGIPQPNESSTVEIEGFGKTSGSAGSTKTLESNQTVTSVGISVSHNGQGDAIPPDLAGSHKVRVSVTVKDIPTATLPPTNTPLPTNTPIPTAIDQLLTPVPIESTATATILPTATTLPTSTPIADDCPAPNFVDGISGQCVPNNPGPKQSVDLALASICPVDNVRYAQVLETEKEGITTRVLINDDEHNTVAFSWSDEDGTVLSYPTLRQGWYTAFIYVRNYFGGVKRFVINLTPDDFGVAENCTVETVKVTSPTPTDVSIAPTPTDVPAAPPQFRAGEVQLSSNSVSPKLIDDVLSIVVGILVFLSFCALCVVVYRKLNP